MEAPSEQEETAPPSPKFERMMTRAMAKAAQDAHQVNACRPAFARKINLINAKAWEIWEFLIKHYPHAKWLHENLHFGPPIFCDEFGLPIKEIGGGRMPAWIDKRRRYLKSLPQFKRNLLLTGDPYQVFSPETYELISSFPDAVPPEIAEEFPHLLPEPVNPEEVALPDDTDISSDEEDSSSSSGGFQTAQSQLGSSSASSSSGDSYDRTLVADNTVVHVTPTKSASWPGKNLAQRVIQTGQRLLSRNEGRSGLRPREAIHPPDKYTPPPRSKKES